MIFQGISKSLLRQQSKVLITRQAPKWSAVRSMSTSPWSQFEMAPVDPIVGLNEIYNKDDFPQKVIVGVGAYRDDQGKPYVLPCVREAEQILMDKKLDMEYTGIAGEPKFVDLALKFAYGEDSAPIQENRVHGVQALSGTGGLRVYGELMRKHGHKHIYVPNPTWGNHIPIFTNSGLEVRKYRYYDAESSDLDFENMMKDIKDMPKGSLVLLHACE
jgi:aspartate aminotransferase